VLSAWIRELGFIAKVAPEINREKLAATAGLGEINGDGRLVTPQYGAAVHVAGIILTDLPLAPDGEL
jgi:epoxyqueuosine reductase QueG